MLFLWSIKTTVKNLPCQKTLKSGQMIPTDPDTVQMRNRQDSGSVAPMSVLCLTVAFGRRQ